MKKVFLVVLLVLASLAFAVPNQPSFYARTKLNEEQVAQQTGLQPYSTATKFMSLSGYGRFLWHQQTGDWIDAEAALEKLPQMLQKKDPIPPRAG